MKVRQNDICPEVFDAEVPDSANYRLHNLRKPSRSNG